jgi:hypothetical protein
MVGWLPRAERSYMIEGRQSLDETAVTGRCRRVVQPTGYQPSYRLPDSSLLFRKALRSERSPLSLCATCCMSRIVRGHDIPALGRGIGWPQTMARRLLPWAARTSRSGFPVGRPRELQAVACVLIPRHAGHEEKDRKGIGLPADRARPKGAKPWQRATRLPHRRPDRL